MTQHPISPVYDEHSRILILGSFPSVKSREERFFYGHPQNRFWKVLSAVFERDLPVTVEEKKTLLLDCGVGCDCFLRDHRQCGQFHPECGAQ